MAYLLDRQLILLSLVLMSGYGVNNADEVSRNGKHPERSPIGVGDGLLESNARSAPEIASAIRPEWVAWKKKVQKTYPDSLILGRGGVIIAIAPNGGVLSAKFRQVVNMDSVLQKETLSVLSSVRFREVQSAHIDTIEFPVAFNSN